ncbi:reductase [Angustibacter aerolatus]|uniref:Reductase n=1 Tax=Angustibacter aerolatus TaxID=1162965 RepID=A0ABQ6JPW3_9ACTN|nr:FAD/NAD(P)-binding oxidoreductase [Angustibacter aerolatus]GMA89300.1 reductase [Angustibacter aerolatus]
MADLDVDLLVIGSGPAAVAALGAFRAARPDGVVALVTDDDRPPYDRPPLSKDFLRGETDEGDLLTAPATAYATDLHLDLRLRTRVDALDAAQRLARTADATVRYGTALLATGSEPVRLPVPGGDRVRTRYLRSAHDGRALRDAAAGAGSAVVIGSGLIGCEAAVSLALRGLRVTVVGREDVPQAARLGDEVGGRLLGWLREAGVDVRGGAGVSAIEHGDAGSRVRSTTAPRSRATSCWRRPGWRSAASLAAMAGAAMHGHRVVTDASMRTSLPHLLAAGDVAHALNTAAGRHLSVEHWGDAEGMGEVAGSTAAGGTSTWDAVPGFWSEIGERVLQQHAWGDGHDEIRFVGHGGDAFAAWYGRAGRTVGVVTHAADDEYERGEALVRDGAPLPG